MSSLCQVQGEPQARTSTTLTDEHYTDWMPAIGVDTLWITQKVANMSAVALNEDVRTSPEGQTYFRLGQAYKPRATGLAKADVACGPNSVPCSLCLDRSSCA